tara:strand:- start:3308 stop:4789 length:1482 start_codon:yes stop_codon:yes gene_type:complete
MIRGFLNTYKSSPDSIAVTIDHKSYSYKEVYGMAFQISDQLSTEKSLLIGIYTDNNIYTYSALVGILLSGKGFVPLNSNYPDERIKSIIKQLSLSITVGCAVSKDRLQNIQEDVEYIVSDSGTTLPVTHIEFNPMPSQVAYALFTSGSTGTPKGIPISFSNFDKLLESSLERWEIIPQDKVLQAFELSFDISIGVTFMTWEAGAELVVTSFEGITAVNAYKAIMDNEVTFAVLPPSSISFLHKFKMLKDIKIPSVKTTLFIGEALLVDHVEKWKNGAVNSKIINTYGPTEATVWCFAYNINPTTDAEAINGGCPIGKPMLTTSYWIDYSKGFENDQGELCLIGPQVFDGYINNESKTTEVLFKNEENKTLYRTGDIVVINKNEDLVYINRIDNQVKINGFRIELGEIEHALRKVCNTSKVIAYVEEIMGVMTIQSIVEKEKTDVSKIKGDLGIILPSYMIPRNIHFIDVMPLNASGKIDRNKLKAQFTHGNKD